MSYYRFSPQLKQGIKKVGPRTDSVANKWLAHTVCGKAILSLIQSRKSNRDGILDGYFVQNNGLVFSCQIYYIKHLIHVFIFFPHAVHVEMKGRHGYLSASDWPLYPVMML